MNAHRAARASRGERVEHLAEWLRSLPDDDYLTIEDIAVVTGLARDSVEDVVLRAERAQVAVIDREQRPQRISASPLPCPYLEALGAPRTAAQLAAAVDRKERNVRYRLARLIAEGAVEALPTTPTAYRRTDATDR